MKSLKEILNTSVEDLNKLSLDEIDLYIDKLDEITPDFDIEKINQHVYRFTIDDLVYQVEMTESLFVPWHPTTLNKDKKKTIEIKFKLLNNPKLPKSSDFKDQYQYQIALKKSQVGITGTGNPLKVFKKVIGSIIKTIEEISPDYITFVADETNRQQLYNKLIGVIGKYINSQYVKIDASPLTGDKCGEEEFWMQKVEKVVDK